ncbi:MAG: hypothetical protein FWD12_10775 [Alphaproteobacteria bacterium]|nr:hypothetical protein [Alphaproteobacteria bacterium]
MTDPQTDQGMIGLFWVVEDGGRAVLLAHTVPLGQAEPYGDMLTTESGHYHIWLGLARRGVAGLRKAGLPTAPAWSEYEEWPRGRVIYDHKRRRFIIRADRQLHKPAFVRLIADRFRIAAEDAKIFGDDHYRSLRRLPPPAPQ